MRAVINVSTKKYRKGQDRLFQTLNGNTDAEILMFKSEKEVSAQLHTENMYGFKPYAFKKAEYIGFSTVLWLDASMYVLKDLSPIFEQIESDGYFFQNSGWENSQWMNARGREYYGEPTGDMISSGVIGLNLKHTDGIEFLRRWHRDMRYGLFNGSHSDWRHDQSCASLIINNMGLKITPNNTFWQYGKPEEKPLHENILILANGIV